MGIRNSGKGACKIPGRWFLNLSTQGSHSAGDQITTKKPGDGENYMRPKKAYFKPIGLVCGIQTLLKHRLKLFSSHA